MEPQPPLGTMLFIMGALLVALILTLATPAFAYSPCPVGVFRDVQDTPMLATAQDVRDARAGTCRVRFGSETMVISGLPENYVSYSAWRVRMP